MNLLIGLEAFAAQFEAQVMNAHTPTSEHGIHFCLALGLQAVYGLPTGSIVFERSIKGLHTDLWVMPFDLAIEVKFRKPIPSGATQAVTMLYGHLLADFSKLAAVPATTRMVLLVSDQPALTSLKHNSPHLLPFTVGERKMIQAADIRVLPATAATHAVGDGPWRSLTAELLWAKECKGWHLLAWQVEPAGDGSEAMI